MSRSRFSNSGRIERTLSERTCRDATPNEEALLLSARWSAPFPLKFVAGKPGYDGYLDAATSNGNAEVSVTAAGR